MTHTPEQLAEYLRMLNGVGVEVRCDIGPVRPDLHGEIVAYHATDGYKVGTLPTDVARAFIRIAAEDVVREEFEKERDNIIGDKRAAIYEQWAGILFSDDPLRRAVEAAVRLRGGK